MTGFMPRLSATLHQGTDTWRGNFCKAAILVQSTTCQSKNINIVKQFHIHPDNP